jgi:putative ABC transport system permease protein
VQVGSGVSLAAVLTGIGVGVWVSLSFALLPILATRRVSPLEALRRRLESQPAAAGRDGWVWGARLALAASVVGLVAMQAGDREVGIGFSAGVAATLLLLWACAWLVVHALRRARMAGLPFPARQGIANLHRPGNQTRTVVLSLGFGVFLLATLYLVQDNLLRPLRPGAEGARANLVLFDVQEDQEEGAAAILSGAGVEVLQRAPIVPMRVAAINGRPVARIAPRSDSAAADSAAEGGPGSPGGDDPGGGQPRGWAVRREYRSTFRDTVVSSETMLQGKLWAPGGGGAGPDGVAEVSLEQGIAQDLGVGLGDRVTWDVQGVPIATRVTSIREVDWRRLEPNFFAVFPSEVLSGAPQTWVVLARTPSAEVRARVQRDVVARYSNISAVDLTQVQAAVDDVLGRVALVIRFLAAFSVATGIVVLLGAILTSRLQRVRESVLLRTLGATQRQVRAILLAEYLALGTAAGLSGVLFAVGAGWALSRWLFEMDFGVPVGPLAVLVAGVAVLCALVGLWASGEVFRRTPLEMLREE